MSSRPKDDIRRWWKTKRPDPATRTEVSASICGFIVASLEFRQAPLVSLFCGRATEPDLGLLWKFRPASCAFPKVVGQDLHFYRIEKWEDLKPGVLGILEPPTTAERVEFVDNKDLLLIPGTAFDRYGGRIGTGAGYYDRFLANVKGQKWGIAFSEQILNERLAQDETDVRMAAVVSERGIERIEFQ